MSKEEREKVILDCPRKELLEAVQLAGTPATGRQTTIPIFGSLLVEAKDNQLRLVGCDGEMWVERVVPSMVTETGTVTLNARLLQDILGRLPDGDVHLEQTNSSSVLMSLGHSDFKMVVGNHPDDFPTVPGVAASAQISLGFEAFREAVESVKFAVAPETQGRPILTGILFSYDGEKLHTVATDTHRLAVHSKPFSSIGDTVDAVIPLRALNVIERLPVPDDAEIVLTLGEGKVVVETDGAKVVSQLLEGNFPPYQRVIPDSYIRRWVIAREELTDALRRELILAKENSNRIILSSSGDWLEMRARSEGLGEATDVLDIVAEGDDLEIAFNGRYLLDALEAMKSESVSLELTENDRPAVLKPAEEDPSFLCVIMPMAM
ncbi:MAG: DNA polymerase III subunit beta [Fimbriimonadales bacterium]|jgi:DNA polymerase-3 subunit beta|nr:MAG: DNA polymerase III subunit beta [Fimbriimonadales bacterium]